ncbi:MAG: hypothetical protein AB7S38_23535 [Vulcanimicrobiota bacterium]
MATMIQALYAAYGGEEHDVPQGSLPRLLALVEDWLEGKGEREELLGALQTQQAELVRAARQTVVQPHLDPGLAELLGFQKEVFEELASSVEDLRSAVVCLDPALIESQAARLEDGVAALREVTDELHQWQNTGQVRCLRCGREGLVCPHCGLMGLVADLEWEGREHETGQLGRVGGHLYRTFQAVLEGKSCLTRLLHQLQSLEPELAQVAQLATEWCGQEALADEILADLVAVEDGLARMAACAQTRRLTDLAIGWELFFRAWRDLQARLYPSLALAS